jgi:hypothetical protein
MMMKKTSLYISIVAVLALTLNNSCKKALKNVDDYLPKVSIVSAEIQADGSVLVTGNIDSRGYAEVEYAGFSCNTHSEPKMLERQVIADVNGSTFTAIYKGFDVDSTYYFRSWATNKYGYRYGTEVPLNQIIAPAVTPACTLPMNTLNLGTGGGTYTYYYVDAPVNNWQTWDFQASPSSGPTINFSFGSAVTTGIYTTEISTSPGAGKVSVYFYLGGSGYSLNDGSKVYVNTIGKDTVDITICNAPWQYNATTTFSMNTRLTSPF